MELTSASAAIHSAQILFRPLEGVHGMDLSSPRQTVLGRTRLPVATLEHPGTTARLSHSSVKHGRPLSLLSDVRGVNHGRERSPEFGVRNANAHRVPDFVVLRIHVNATSSAKVILGPLSSPDPFPSDTGYFKRKIHFSGTSPQTLSPVTRAISSAKVIFGTSIIPRSLPQ